MVREHGTGELLDLAESLLRLAQQRRDGDPAAAAAMEQRLASLDVYQLQQLVQDLRLYARNKSDAASSRNDSVEEGIEALAHDLDVALADEREAVLASEASS